jgi:hypothetical protein
MALHMRRAEGVDWRFALLMVFAALSAGVASGDEPLFPHPLHLTRVIEDPISRSEFSVDEYCVGSRVVTVRGERVFIADYQRQEMTEIDRSTSTYSITRFDEIARAAGSLAGSPPSDAQAIGTSPAASSRGVRRGESGRDLEVFEITQQDERVEVAVDRSVTLTRAAFDVLTGAAFPHRPRRNHELIARVSRRTSGREVQTDSTADVATFGLPAEQITRWDFEGRTVTLRSVVTRVGTEQPSPELLSIPPGARQVESRYSAIHHLSEALDGRRQISNH